MLIASVLLIALGASQLRFVGPAHAPLIRLSGPMALAFGLAAASIFPALMMGIFTKVNNKGAVAGMLAGLLVTLLYIFLHKGWLFIAGTNSFPDTVDGSLFGIQSTGQSGAGPFMSKGE